MSASNVELRLQDAAGNVVARQLFFADKPNEGVEILHDGQYHPNLQTAGLNLGTYILQYARTQDETLLIWVDNVLLLFYYETVEGLYEPGIFPASLECKAGRLAVQAG